MAEKHQDESPSPIHRQRPDGAVRADKGKSRALSPSSIMGTPAFLADTGPAVYQGWCRRLRSLRRCRRERSRLSGV